MKSLPTSSSAFRFLWFLSSTLVCHPRPPSPVSTHRLPTWYHSVLINRAQVYPKKVKIAQVSLPRAVAEPPVLQSQPPEVAEPGARPRIEVELQPGAEEFTALVIAPGIIIFGLGIDQLPRKGRFYPHPALGAKQVFVGEHGVDEEQVQRALAHRIPPHIHRRGLPQGPRPSRRRGAEFLPAAILVADEPDVIGAEQRDGAIGRGPASVGDSAGRHAQHPGLDADAVGAHDEVLGPPDWQPGQEQAARRPRPRARHPPGEAAPRKHAGAGGA